MKLQHNLTKKILLTTLLACGVCSSAYASFASRVYFPIPATNSSWTYSENCGFGATTVTHTVTGVTASINSKTARQISYTSTESSFFSSDAASGIQFHRYLDTDPLGPVTDTVTPAYTLAPANITLGVTTNNSGTVATTVPLVTGVTYSGASTPTQFELVSTPAGPFRALRTNLTLNLSYTYDGTPGFLDNDTITRWSVRGVGIVKENESITSNDGSPPINCTTDITTQNWRPIANFTVRNDAVFDFGASGLWIRTQDGTFTRIHTANAAKVLASADIDGNGQNDIVVDFGTGVGTYVWMNNSAYVFLHPGSPEGVYAANLNANALTDLVMDFGSSGLWTYVDNSTYTFVHSANPSHIVVGNINGSSVDDFVVEFGGGGGIWAYVDNNLAAPVFVHPGALNNIARGDIDGDGFNNVILDFASGGGIWNFDYNSRSFTFIHPGTTNHIVRADLDENGVADLVMDFAGSGGIWRYMNNAGFSFIHPSTAVNIEANEWNNAGSTDVLIDFGAGGLWVLQDNAGFVFIRPGNIDSLTATEVNKL